MKSYVILPALLLCQIGSAQYFEAREDHNSSSFYQKEFPRKNIAQYEAKDFSHLQGMPGFSDQALTTHFTLYKGYVKNTNLLLKNLEEMRENKEMSTPYFAELKRRFGWEFNGMRLHELYFENLGGAHKEKRKHALYHAIEEQFGSFAHWQEDFQKTGAMRGIGWVILYLDNQTGRLMNEWVAEHDVGHLAGATPIVVMDVWEHAYMVDYGIKRAPYMDAFFKNIDWDIANQRFQQR